MPKAPPQIPAHLRSCRDSLGDYYLALNPSWGYVDYQQERMIPALEAVEAGDIQRLAIFMPPGHAKSAIGTLAFIPWYLARNPGKNVILACHSEGLSGDFGSAIRDTMTGNETHMAIFPECRVNNANRAKNFLKTSQGNSFYAFGMDSGVTGRRADLLLMDDPIRTIDDALSEATQSHLLNVYKAVLKDRLRPDGKIVLIMHRWTVRDLAARILEEEGARWKVLYLKAEEEMPEVKDGQPTGRYVPSGKYLWESFYGRDKYEEAKEDDYIWNAKWQQMPTAFISQPFQQDWLRFYLPEAAKPMLNERGELIGIPTDFGKLVKHNAYILVDPALGKGTQHDRTCILVLVAGPERRIFWVDGVLDRLDPSERIEHLVRLSKLWHPKMLGYEEYGLVSDTHFLEKRFQEEGLNTPIISLGRKGIKGLGGGRLKKHDRIMQLQADFKEGRIWIPRKMNRVLLDGTAFDLVKYAVEKEILPYAGAGSVAHDEFLDTLSRIHDQEFVIEHAASDEDDEYDYDHASSGGTWESNY